jgi:hypothetical protein
VFASYGTHFTYFTDYLPVCCFDRWLLSLETPLSERAAVRIRT